jgi:hypothetical protein
MSYQRDFFSLNLRPEEEYEITIRFPPNESDGKINQETSEKLAGEFKERAIKEAGKYRKIISFEDLGVDNDEVSVHAVIAGNGIPENRGCHLNFLRLIASTFPHNKVKCFKIVYLRE